MILCFSWANVNAQHPVYDYRNTPSCVGLLTNLFRNNRSIHKVLKPIQDLAATAARLDPEGNRVMPVACDVSDPDSVAQAFQAVERRFTADEIRAFCSILGTFTEEYKKDF